MESFVIQTKSGPKVKIFGPRLQSLRQDLGLSQEEMAQKLGMSKSSVSRLEQDGGPMRLSNFRKLADVVGVEMAVLFERIGAREGELAGAGSKPSKGESIALPSALADALRPHRKDGSLSDLVLTILQKWLTDHVPHPRSGVTTGPRGGGVHQPHSPSPAGSGK